MPPHLVKPSTRAFTREARKVPGFSFFDWLHGYFYARWPYFYISVGTGEHRLTRFFLPIWNAFTKIFGTESEENGKNQQMAFADGYHGKVVPLEQATRLVRINKPINIRNLEQVVPYARARDIIMHNPDHIVALECPCRAARANPCTPTDVCLIVGEPFAGFITEHQPSRSRWITQDEAADILEAEHKRGHVHHAFFKDAMLGRFYAICNCCACCCGAMQAWRGGTPMLASSGYVCHVYEDRCVGCGSCAEACQFRALELRDGVIHVDEALCMGCGACVTKCKKDAHYLVRDERRGEPLEIHELMSRAAQEASAGVTVAANDSALA